LNEDKIKSDELILKYQEDIKLINESLEKKIKNTDEEKLTSEMNKIEEMNNIINEQSSKIKSLEHALADETMKLANILNEDKSRNDEKSHVLLTSIDKLEKKYEFDLKDKDNMIIKLNTKVEE
jgi:hypothetical protein